MVKSVNKLRREIGLPALKHPGDGTRGATNRDITLAILWMIKNQPKAIKSMIFYRRPVIFVLIISRSGKIGVGWSKVCRPDKWDPKKGKIIATARAARDLARQILTGDQSHLYEEQEDKEPSGSGAKTD